MRRTFATVSVAVATLAVAVLLTSHLHRQASQRVLSQFAGDQLILARHLSREVSSEFWARSRALLALAALPSVQLHDRERMTADLRSPLGNLERRHVVDITERKVAEEALRETLPARPVTRAAARRGRPGAFGAGAREPGGERL